MPQPKKTSTATTVIAVILGLCGFCCIGNIIVGKTRPPSVDPPGTAPAARQYVQQSCAEVSHLFGMQSRTTELQQTELWRQYDDRWVRWEVQAGEVGETFGRLHMQFKCGTESLILDGTAYFSDASRAALTGIVRGSTVQIEGRLAGHGRLLGLDVRDATLSAIPAPSGPAPAAPPAAAPTGAADPSVGQAAPAPMSVLRSAVRPDVIGTPQLSIVIRNTSRKTIDGFDFEAAMFSAFNEPVNDRFAFQNPTNIYRGTSTDRIGPTRVSDSRRLGDWSLLNFPIATKAVVTVTRVHFTDGTTWVGRSAQIADPRRPEQ